MGLREPIPLKDLFPANVKFRPQRCSNRNPNIQYFMAEAKRTVSNYIEDKVKGFVKFYDELLRNEGKDVTVLIPTMWSRR